MTAGELIHDVDLEELEAAPVPAGSERDILFSFTEGDPDRFDLTLFMGGAPETYTLTRAQALMLADAIIQRFPP